MATSEFITFTVTVSNQGVAQQGFGIPLIPSYSASFVGTRSYSSLSEFAVDFAAGTVEHNAAKALFNQPTHPATVKVGKASNAPTMRYSMTAIAQLPSTRYQVQVDGPGITSTLVDVTSDASTSIAEINTALVTALNAVVGNNYTAAHPALVFADLTYTANAGTDELTSTAHGLQTGDGPVQVANSGGAPPGGLATSTDYFVIRVDANTLKLATSRANAFANTAIDVTSAGTGTQTIIDQPTTTTPILAFTVTGDAPGAWFSLEIKNFALMSNAMTHTDPGITADLDAIKLADDDWYGLVMPWESKEMILAAADWVEGNGRIYTPSTVDTDAITLAVGNGDVLDELFASGYTRTCSKFHPSPIQMFGAASLGAVLPKEPGTWTEAYKTLTGVQPVTLNATQRSRLRDKRAGSYTRERGRNITWDGKVGSDVFGFLDIRVSVDWLTDRVQAAAFGVLVSRDKVAYTDEDIEAITGAVRGVLREAASDAHKILDPGDPTNPADNPPPEVTFPRVADIDPATRALRRIPNGKITGRLQGAAQFIDFEAILTF